MGTAGAPTERASSEPALPLADYSDADPGLIPEQRAGGDQNKGPEDG